MGVPRHYLKAWSPALGRDMEALRFGDSGMPVLVFPTSMGRFYQWEDFGLVEALADKIEQGHMQLWCVDAVDDESWYATGLHPRDRVARHLAYERHVVEEVISSMPSLPVTIGTSFGAFHALLLALRRPRTVSGFVCLSGAFEAAKWLDGYGDEVTHHANPMAFLPDLNDEGYLGPIRSFHHKAIVTGRDDANAAESIRVGELLKGKGVDVTLDVWDGWYHDWDYWKDWVRRYV